MEERKYTIAIAIISLVLIVGYLIYNYNYREKMETFEKQAAIQVPVLIYHHFYTDEDKEKYEPTKDYSVKISSLDKQMKYLHDNGYKSLTVDQLLCWKEKKCEISEKSFVVSIDDGQKSVLELAKPVFEKYGFTAISFVISSRTPKTIEEYDPSKYQYISEEELKNAGGKVIEWGSHSHNQHEMVGDKKKIYTLSYEELEEDVKTSKIVLNTDYYAYPFNTYNKSIISALKKAGYKLAFRGQNRKTTQSEDKYLTSRIFVSDDMDKFKDIFETNKYDQEEGL